MEDKGKTCFCSKGHTSQINKLECSTKREFETSERRSSYEPEVSNNNSLQAQLSIEMKSTIINTANNNYDNNNNNNSHHEDEKSANISCYNNNDYNQLKLKRDVIKEICPLIKHNKNRSKSAIKLNSDALLPTQMRAQAPDKAKSMAATAAVRLLEPNGSRSMKPLRQINIVGQLNHSANKGFLLILNLMVLILMIGTGIGPQDGITETEASVWPFNAMKPGGQAKTHLPWPLQSATNRDTATATASSKRKARNSESAPSPGSASQGQNNLMGGDNRLAQLPAVPAPLSQQFHYFWNHDRIEPKVVASEANKILTDAQIRTNQLALSQHQHHHQHYQPNTQETLQSRDGSDTVTPGKQQPESAQLAASSARQDPMQGSASNLILAPEVQMLIPPAIQQQLTGMVLQMQRQQQASMMMQPRFPAPTPAAAAFASAGAQRRHAAMAHQPAALLAAQSFMNPMGRYWMSGSTQYPVIAAPPQMQMPAFNQMLTSESMQATNGPLSPYGQMGLMAPRQPQAAPTGTATMAGVPVFGPFMVSPTVSSPMSALNSQFGAQSALTRLPSSSNGSGNQQSTPNKLTSSLVSRRKSWLESLGLGSSLSDKVSLLGSASQPRVAVVPAPSSLSAQRIQQQQQQQQQQQRQQHAQMAAMGSFPIDSMSLTDMASSQLANAIAGQLQNRFAQQQLAIALARAIEQTSGDIQSSASISNVQHINPPQSSGGGPHSTARRPLNLQAPYSIAPSLLNHPTGADLHLANLEQPSQSFDLTGTNPFMNISDLSYGNRLKRRHLNTLLAQQHLRKQPKQSVKKSPNGPSSHGLGIDNNNWSFEPNQSAQAATADYREPVIEQYYGNSPFSNAQEDRFNMLESSEMPVRIKIKPTTTTNTRAKHTESSASSKPLSASTNPVRIVKKDASNLLDANRKNRIQTQPDLGGGQNFENNLQHLFMIMTTESPPAKSSVDFLLDIKSNATDDEAFSQVESDQGQTQLRRLKRSTPSYGRREAKSLNWGSSWKSMSKSVENDTILVDNELAAKVAKIAEPKLKPIEPITQSSHETTTEFSSSRWGFSTVRPLSFAKMEPIGKQSSWSSIPGPVLPQSQMLMKRQSDESQTSAGSSTGGSVVGGSANATAETAGSSQTPRQEKSLKVKRISASASVLHHPISKSHEKSQLASKQGFILSGFPMSLKPNSIQSSTSTSISISSSSSSSSGSGSGASGSSGASGQKEVKASATSGNGSGQQKQLAGDVNANANSNTDPMSASLSESARVVNYFQNVDNEKTPANDQKQQAQSNQGSSQVPQINVGFSAPKVTLGHSFDRQNDTQESANNHLDATNDLRRQPLHQQLQHSGNLMSSQSSVLQTNVGLSPARLMTQAMMIGLRQRQQQQLQAGANNGDMSSSATRSVPYTINNMPPPGLSSDGGGQQQQQQSPRSSGSHQGGGGGPVGSVGQLAMSIDPTGTSNHARVGSIVQTPASQGGNLLNLQGKIFNAFLGLDKSQARISSSSSNSMVPIFGATSQTRQSIVAPGSKLQTSNSQQQQQQQQQPLQSQQQQSMSSSYDRTSSADQSNNYNEEMLPSSQGSSGSNNGQNMFGGPSGSLSEGPGSDQQGGNANSGPSSYGSMDQSTGGNEQQQNNGDTNNGGNMMGYGEDSFGSRTPSMGPNSGAGVSSNGGSNPMDLVSGIDQGGMDLAKFNQQQNQQQSSQTQQQLFANSFNQTDNLVSDGPDSTSLYGGPFAQNSFNQQASPSEDPQILTSQSNQPMMTQQPQFYSQQMQALGAAVSNYNQQRFNQQLQDAALRNQFNNQNRNMFSQSMERPMRHSASLQQQHSAMHAAPNSALWTGVDEEAAAGAAAAAGIPSYPNAAQLMALQSQGHMVDGNLNNMMMAGTVPQRSELGDEENGKAKKAKRKSAKQVSHHYHFNNLASPFEDPESQFSPLSPLELVGSTPYAHDGFAPRPKPKPKAPKEEEKQEEEQKPKKKGFLRRFSIKNLFKKLKKDKKKGNESNDENNNNNGGGESTGER